jgi:hypothetical protein
MGFGRSLTFDRLLLGLVLAAYLAGFFLIGTFLPADKSYHFDAPADVDFLYYAGIISQAGHSIPPQNPAYGGTVVGQSFLQYYPPLILTPLVNPYLAMRIFNLIYVILLALVLRRYFAKGWGIFLTVIGAGSIGFGLINSLGIDLVARGFNHFPFFIALIVALFETRRSWVRLMALFLLGWLHAYMALIILIALAATVIFNRFRRDGIVDVVVCLIGLASASLITLGGADKPFYFPFVEGFRFDLTDLWMHALAALPAVILSREARVWILAAAAFVFGAFFHYNPFFPVFLLYFVSGWGLAEAYRQKAITGAIPVAIAALLFTGFVYAAIGKYQPGNGNYVPHLDQTYAPATRWLKSNTPPTAVVLTLPLDENWQCRLSECRAVYLGFIPHVAHLGIDWRKRAQNIVNYYRNLPVYIGEIDYVVYGPAEREAFPQFRMTTEPVYADGNVRIWKVAR